MGTWTELSRGRLTRSILVCLLITAVASITVAQPAHAAPDLSGFVGQWRWEAAKRLFAYVDTYYAEKVIDDPAVQPRLHRLLGSEFDHLRRNVEVMSPLGLVGDVLFVQGNAPHQGLEERGLLAIRLYTGGIYVGLYKQGRIRIYSDDNLWKAFAPRHTFNDLPAIVQIWTVWQSKCPVGCTMPAEVELHFGP